MRQLARGGMVGSTLGTVEMAGLFDTLAEGYDRAALRFFPFTADRVAQRLAPRPGEKILDVATGTAAVAVAVAQRLPAGRVMAIDISERMLDRAYANVRRMALHNVDLHPMDAAALEFRAAYFDALTCAFGLDLVVDMPAAVREWRRVLRPGGRMLLTIFAAEAFQPLAAWFCEDLTASGAGPLTPADFTWQRLAKPHSVEQLLDAAGFTEIHSTTEQMGYHLQSAEEWWEIVWNSALRAYLTGVCPAVVDAFRQRHLERVAARFRDGVLPLEIPVTFVAARVPAD